MNKKLYSFELENTYVPKKRICVYAPLEVSDKLQQYARMESEKTNKKISRNKLILKILKDFIKKEYEINL